MPIKQILGFARGVMYYLRGFRMVFSSWRLVSLAVMPMLINILAVAGFLVAFNAGVYGLAHWAFAHTSQAWYMAMLSIIGGAILFLASMAVAALLFVSVGVVVAAPFLEALSAGVERSVTGKVASTGGPLVVETLHIIRSEGRKMAIFLAIQAALALLNLIPVAGSIIFAILNPLFISFVMAYEFTGHPLDRRGYNFSMKRKRIFQQPGLHLGFGAAVGLTMFIPIVQFLLLPMAVAGGTLLALETLPKDSGPADG